MAYEDEDDVVTNPSVHPVAAGIGTWAVLGIKDLLIQKAINMANPPLWGMALRDVLLIGSDVAVGELIPPLVFDTEREGVKTATRVGYGAAIAQTAAVSLIQMVQKYRADRGLTTTQFTSLEEAKAALLEAKTDYEAAQAVYQEAVTREEAKSLPPGQQQPAQTKGYGGSLSNPDAVSPRDSGRISAEEAVMRARARRKRQGGGMV